MLKKKKKSVVFISVQNINAQFIEKKKKSQSNL